MKRVFLDTNILLDFGQSREDHLYAEAIFKLADVGNFALYASFLSYANMGYILRHYPSAQRYEMMRLMRRGVNVLPCLSKHLDYALEHVADDFEDMLQYRCALDAGCDVIVTNNISDYRDFTDIKCMTSHDFLLSFMGLR